MWPMGLLFKCLITCVMTEYKMEIFSSPEPKAQVIFSDQHQSLGLGLSVVVIVVVVIVLVLIENLSITFSSSSPEPLGQFQSNLAQSILL